LRGAGTGMNGSFIVQISKPFLRLICAATHETLDNM
jgi:hypothetical protein